jgi:hypothetical protein
VLGLGRNAALEARPTDRDQLIRSPDQVLIPTESRSGCFYNYRTTKPGVEATCGSRSDRTASLCAAPWAFTTDPIACRAMTQQNWNW